MPRSLKGLAAALAGALIATTLTVTATIAQADESPKLSDSESAETAAGAAAIAKEFGHPVELASETTPTSLTEVLPDGTQRLFSDTLPVRTHKSGRWVPVDTSLTSAADGFVQPKAAAVPVGFSAGGSDVMAKVQTETGEWVSQIWPLGDLPKPTINEATATYTDVLRGVDLKLTATPAGMAEVLVIKDAEAAGDPRLHNLKVKVEGADVSVDPANQATATADDGSTLESSAATWWDSSHPGADASGPGGDGGLRPIDRVASEAGVGLDVQGALDAQPVTYPVYVGPDWSAGAQAYWFTDRAYPNQSYLNGQYADGVQSVGNGGGYLSRAFWQFGVGALSGKTIVTAAFNVTEVWSNTCNGRDIQAWHYGNQAAGFSWNGEGGYWNSLQDTKTLSAGSTCSPAAAVGFSVTGAVNWAASVGNPVVQIGLRAANEADTLTRRHFSQSATLIVTYNTAPKVPTDLSMISPSRVCGTSTNPAYVYNGTGGAITFQARATDPDGGALKVGFYIAKTSNLNALVQQTWAGNPQASGSWQKWTLAASALADGAYAWKSRSSDTTGLTSGYTGWCYFVVDNTPPSLPTVTTTAPADVIGKPMTVTISSDPADKAAGFQVWWAPGEATQTGPSPASTSYRAALPACGDTPDEKTRVYCADANGNATITVAPVDTVRTLWVASYDRAGNVSVDPLDTTKTASTGLAVSVNKDANARAAEHRWSTEVEGVASIADAPNGTLPLNVGSISRWEQQPDAFESAMVFPGFTPITRYYGSGTHVASYDGLGAGTRTLEKITGYLARNTGQGTVAGTNPIYICSLGSTVLSALTSNCDGKGASGTLVGYSWKTAAGVPAPFTATEIFRCRVGTDYFNSASTTCEGQAKEVSLGYFAGYTPTQTDSPSVDTTKSYTVSARVKPRTSTLGAVVSQSGTSNSAFFIRVYQGKWQFCARSQGATSSSACVDGPTAMLDTYSTVSGIWDAVNHQLRMSVHGPNSVLTASTFWDPPADDVPASGPFVVGMNQVEKSPAAVLDGAIAGVSIQQGVLSPQELTTIPLP